jgi:serine/threonine protein kinase
MEEKVKIIFEGREEVLNVINSGGNIVELLGLPKENKCALIGAEIKLGKQLGKGIQGEVFLIEFPGMGEKLYVVKKSELTLSVISGSYDNILQQLKDENLTLEEILRWQPSNIYRKMDSYMSVIIPPKMCRTTEDIEYTSIPRIKGSQKIKIPKGSYLCDNESFSEFCISVYTGTLYRKSVCINFFNIYSMFTCLESRGTNFAEYKQYTFMDKIDGELAKFASCLSLEKYLTFDGHSEDMINGVYIQTLFAIAIYQSEFMISHNDLHTGNVFVEFVTDKTEFKGKKLIKADYYHYKIGESNIYFPAIPVIVKIGDYGKSVKYTKPMIGDKYVFENGYDQGDGGGPWMPNKFIPSYDSLYFTSYYIHHFKGHVSNLGSLIPKCVKYMCNRIKLSDNIYDDLIKQKFITYSNARPILENLMGVKSANDVLKKIIAPLYTKPSKGKIITLGSI